MDLLEREDALSALDAASNDAARGRGRIVLVSGEAGIGKTALVRRFADGHDLLARVLWGACDALFTPRPLGPLFDIARQTKGRLSDLLQAQATHTAIFSALLDELHASALPAIVVIEDTHWADAASLDAIKFLARRIHQVPALLILTYRDDEVNAQHPLRFVLGDLPRDRTLRLPLQPLSEAAVAALAQQEHRSAKGLYAVTGGNPFFVTEVLATSAQDSESVPATIRDSVLSRAARLSAEARAILDVASIVPAEVELWLLEALLPHDATALDECVSGGMLRLDNASLRFRHELARIAVEDSILPTLRRRMHAQVLGALTRQTSHPVALTRLVHHAALAEDREAILRFAPAAAMEAVALGAHREAATHYATALRHADQFEPETRAELFESRAYECYLTDQIDAAMQARMAAYSIWRKLERPDKQGQSLHWLSRLSWYSGNWGEANTYAAQAIDMLEKLPPGSALAMAYSNRAHLHTQALQLADAVKCGQRAIDLARQLGDDEILVTALNSVGTALLYSADPQGQAFLEKSLSISLERNFEESAARAYTVLGWYFVNARQYGRAHQFLDDGVRYCAERDLDVWTLRLTAARIRCLFDTGRWSDAAVDAETVLSRINTTPVNRIEALTLLARVRLRRGDPGVTELLTEAHALAAPTGESQHILQVLLLHVELAWVRGHFAECAREARAGLELAASNTDTWAQAELHYYLWRCNPAYQPPAKVDVGTPFASQIVGNWQAAAEAWAQFGCPYERAMALMDGDSAAQAAALTIFEQLGARPAAEIARNRLQRVPDRQRKKDRLDGLTGREAETASLIAQGKSNREVAEAMTVSVKTVETYVTRILNKLGMDSRVQIATWAVEKGLSSDSDAP